jgi:hypothetical protein
MGYLHSSGAISLSQVQGHWGGGNPISMSEYYRNGSYVPSIYTETTTTTTTTRQPSSGSNYSVLAPAYRWTASGLGVAVVWAGTTISNSAASTATSFTSGGWTYYRSTYVGNSYSFNYYRLYRQQTTTSSSTTTTNINTGIPSSGQISMSQFYGGRN